MPLDSNPRPAARAAGARAVPARPVRTARGVTGTSLGMFSLVAGIWAFSHILVAQIGRASCRERVSDTV